MEHEPDQSMLDRLTVALWGGGALLAVVGLALMMPTWRTAAGAALIVAGLAAVAVGGLQPLVLLVHHGLRTVLNFEPPPESK